MNRLCHKKMFDLLYYVDKLKELFVNSTNQAVFGNKVFAQYRSSNYNFK